MFRSSIRITLLVGFAAAASGQNDHAMPIAGPVENAGVLHLSTSTWEPPTTENPDPASTLGTVIYCNDAPQGLYLKTGKHAIVGDYGRVPGTLSPAPEIGTRPNYKVTGFEFAYCTTEVSGSFGYLVGFHSEVHPCANEILPPAAGAVVLEDLPGSAVAGEVSCWRVSVDLRWADEEFCLGADGEDGVWQNFVLLDSFGYSLTKTGSPTNEGGPILAGDPMGNFGPAATPGDGTAWHDNVGMPGTGLGTEDSYLVKPKYQGVTVCRDVVNEPLAYGSFHLKLYADLSAPPCGNSFSSVIGSTYCEPAAENSNSYPGEIIATGSPVQGHGDFTLWAANLPPQKETGYFLMGDAKSLVFPPDAAGPLCVGGDGLTRILPVHYTNELLGGFNEKVSFGNYWSAITPGSTWHFQAWYRDGSGPSNLTNAVSVTFE